MTEKGVLDRYMFKHMGQNLTLANVITGSRLVFFVIFIWAAHTQRLGLVISMFLIAWGLDAMDGWVARRMRQATVVGYVFDKVVDRVVIFVGLLVLLVNGLVPDYALLILTKDLAALPAVSKQLGSTKVMPSMGWLGKMVTMMQGIAVVWVLIGVPVGRWVVLLVASFGVVAGGQYVYRVYYKGG